MTAKKTARGIRNFNPGNIKYDPKAPKWQGLATPPTDGVFCVFESAPFGIRALARTLITYQDKRRAPDGSAIDSIAEIIGRWAPTNENDTDAYIRSVCDRTGLGPNAYADLHRYDVLRPIVEAIIRHENGAMPYSDAEIDQGLALAGVKPPMKPLSKSRTIQGAQGVGGLGLITVAAGVAEQVAPVVEQVQTLMPALEWVKANFGLAMILLGVALAAGAIYIAKARIEDRARGLR